MFVVVVHCYLNNTVIVELHVIIDMLCFVVHANSIGFMGDASAVSG